MRGELDFRETDDISGSSLSYAEVSAISAGDMRILEKMTIEADTQNL